MQLGDVAISKYIVHILKNWKVHGKTDTKSSMGIGGLMCWTSYTNIWTVVTFIWVPLKIKFSSS